MAAVDPSLFETFPNLAFTPAEVLSGEALLDLGEDQTRYTDIVAEVGASG
jgi:spermidine/putrescine transport system substrate-binding protein